MAFPKIYYTDLSDYQIINIDEVTSTTANLLNYFTDELWVSPNNNNQIMTIGFSVAKTCDYLLLDPFISEGNLSYIILAGADDAAMTINAVTVIDYMSLDIIAAGPLIIKFNETTKKFWRLTFLGWNTPPSAGNIWIDKSLTFTSSYQWDYSKEDASYVTNEFVALNGKIRTSQKYDGRLIYDLKFSLQDDTLRSTFQTFIKTIKGKLRPFYFVDDGYVYAGNGNPGHNYYINVGTIRYMHMDSDYTPLNTRFYGKHDIGTLKMKTKYSNF
mgnify:CR=1 FL=1